MTYIVQDPTKNTAVEAGKLRYADEEDMAAQQKEMFLKLMIAQLKNQDPSAPMDQKDMMGQIAQLSEIENMSNMTKAMEGLALSQGVDMIGKHVEYRYPVLDADGAKIGNRTTIGKVDHVAMKDGVVSLVMEGGAVVKPNNVLTVNNDPIAPTADDLAPLVGRYIKYDVTTTGTDGTTTKEQRTGQVNSVTKIGDVHALRLTDGTTVYPEQVAFNQGTPFADPTVTP
jgi:flagellar basal-body rod modification protein FlgD